MLVAVQVTLGALTVLSRRDVWINSVHVVCGALVLATSLVITLRSWRGDSRRPLRLESRTADGARPAEAGRRRSRRRPDRAVRSPRVKTRETPARLGAARRSRALVALLADYVALTKPRLNFLVVADQRGRLLPRRDRPARPGARWRRRSPGRRSSPAAPRC